MHIEEGRLLDDLIIHNMISVHKVTFRMICDRIKLKEQYHDNIEKEIFIHSFDLLKSIFSSY